MSEVTLLWMLLGRDGECKGIYTSEQSLKDGVEYWMLIAPNETLSWQEWDANYAPEPNSWDWAYIEPGALPYNLAQGGGSVPVRSYWGKNLIGLEVPRIPEWDAAYE